MSMMTSKKIIAWMKAGLTTGAGAKREMRITGPQTRVEGAMLLEANTVTGNVATRIVKSTMIDMLAAAVTLPKGGMKIENGIATEGTKMNREQAGAKSMLFVPVDVIRRMEKKFRPASGRRHR